MQKRERKVGIGVVLLAALACAFDAAAQSWPTKPVRVVAPFAPGGAADTLGRLFAMKLTEAFGVNFVVENRAGAGGVIGSDIVAKTAADGYTFVVSGVASHAVAPAVSKVPYDPVKSFTHVALFGGPPTVFAVHPSMPVKDLKSFVAFAKARPGELTYGSPGNGTQGHLVAELFKRDSGVDLRHVPYKGAAIAVVDAVAGNIHTISTTVSTAAAQIRAQRLRGLALSSGQRLGAYPDLPTFRELGYPQLVATVWFGLSAPAGLSPDIAKRLEAEVARILQLPDVRERMRRDGIEPAAPGGKSYGEFVASELARWTPLVRGSGAKRD